MATPNKEEKKQPQDEKTAAAGPTSVPAGTGAAEKEAETPAEKPKRTRGPRKAVASALTQGDLMEFDELLTDQIKKGRRDDAVSDEQLASWAATRQRVRGLITPPADKGGAQ